MWMQEVWFRDCSVGRKSNRLLLQCVRYSICGCRDVPEDKQAGIGRDLSEDGRNRQRYQGLTAARKGN